MVPTKAFIEELYRQEVEDARAMDPADKLLAGPRLFDMVCRIMTDGIRNQFPGITEEQVQKVLLERLQLARKLENRNDL